MVELPRLVDLAADRLGLNIEYDTRLTGSVTLRLHNDLNNTDLWILTNRLLRAQGFTTVHMANDDTLSVVPIGTAGSLARMESLDRYQESANGVTAGFRAVLIPIDARSLDDIVSSITPLLSPSGTATAIPQSRHVLVMDLSPRIEAIIPAIASLESDTAAIRPVEVPVINLPAERIVTLLAQLTAKRAASGASPVRGEIMAGPDNRSILIVAPPGEIEKWRDLVAQFDRREADQTVSYSSGGMNASQIAGSLTNLLGESASNNGFSVAADDLTGSLVVTATPAQHERVLAILERLAESPEAVRRPTRTFRLKNRDAEEVVGIVQSLISSGVVTGSTPESNTGTASAGSALLPRPTGTEAATRELQLTADPGTNSIIAIGEVAELERLERLLKDLDVRRPQVLLEILIVSLSESDSLDLGVEIDALINGPNDTVAKLSSLFGLSSTGASASGIDGNRGAGLTGIVLNPGDFSVVLRALQSLNEGRSLSIPKILVASNEQASLNSVLEQPFTTLNASDTVATTSFGGSSDAGTEVSVRPQIAEGDHLRLEYQISLSAFVGDAADSSVPPPRQQNSIDSVATIPDGYTIAVGGIELTTEGYAETGIPFLSDIPLLGEVFKNRSKSGSRSRFYVFIRPTILRDRDFEGLKNLSDLRLTETGIDDGWPEPQPRLIR
ncbi:MAG: secretin N-terminal domain-containing protein [Planctomycetota bacterium]|nr:secretin N-terminal domain-containing protein [Planctomycetota bacterium]